MGSLTLNDFYTIAGGEQYTLQIFFIVTRGIIKGQDYAFRYRSINAIGAGEWSEITYIKAATVPEPPGQPYYIESTSISIKLGLRGTGDNGGSKITEYKLFRDSGDLSSDLTTEIVAYNGIDTEFTVTGLTAGVIYRFNYFALNEFGSSSASLILTIAATKLPDPPTDITIDWKRSNKT